MYRLVYIRLAFLYILFPRWQKHYEDNAIKSWLCHLSRIPFYRQDLNKVLNMLGINFYQVSLHLLGQIGKETCHMFIVAWAADANCFI